MTETPLSVEGVTPSIESKSQEEVAPSKLEESPVDTQTEKGGNNRVIIDSLQAYNSLVSTDGL